MTDDELADWLRRHWDEAQEHAGQVDPEIDRFVDSETTSIRYAFVTQLVPVLVVEVKDRTIGLTDLRSAITKARNSKLRSVLFAAPDVMSSEIQEVKSTIADEWSKGTNVYHVTLESLVRTVFVLLDEAWRITLLSEVGKELDDLGASLGVRESWRNLLEEA